MTVFKYTDFQMCRVRGVVGSGGGAWQYLSTVLHVSEKWTHVTWKKQRDHVTSLLVDS